MRTDGSTGGARYAQGFKAKLTSQSQRAALDNPLASKSSKERRFETAVGLVRRFVNRRSLMAIPSPAPLNFPV
jgi:hypothetical protein